LHGKLLVLCEGFSAVLPTKYEAAIAVFDFPFWPPVTPQSESFIFKVFFSHAQAYCSCHNLSEFEQIFRLVDNSSICICTKDSCNCFVHVPDRTNNYDKDINRCTLPPVSRLYLAFFCVYVSKKFKGRKHHFFSPLPVCHSFWFAFVFFLIKVWLEKAKHVSPMSR